MASFGENLRRERELRGVTLRAIADATKISVRFLEALEQERMDILPGGIFRRAFLRQYARFVGLDPERVLTDFDQTFAEEETVPETLPASAPSWPIRGALVAAGVVVVLGAVLLLRSNRDKASTGPSSPPPASVPSSPLWGSDRVYPPPSAASESEPAGLVLTLNARQACWVAARVDGANVLGKVLAPGETETIEAAREIVLSVGNAGGLEFSVNDRPGLPLGRSGEVRRNIVITRQSLPSLIQETSQKSPHS